jgi:hypothetical protein
VENYSLQHPTSLNLRLGNLFWNLADLWKIDVCIEIMKTAAQGNRNESEIISLTMDRTIAAGGTVKDCLGVLVTIGFVEFDETTRKYKTTERGGKFAAIFEELSIAYPGEQERDRMIPLSRQGY